MKEAILFIDGSCQDNPGPAGIGIILKDKEGNLLKEISKPIGFATNNIAEYLAFIYGLQEALSQRMESLKVYSDSQLLINQISGKFKVKDKFLKILHLLSRHLKEKFKRVSLYKISSADNKEADKLAKKAAREGMK